MWFGKLKSTAILSLVSLTLAQSSSPSNSGSGTVVASTVTASSGGASSGSVVVTSTYSQSNVPTGTPIAGNYNDEYRPQVHFSPPKGFMNDPNGMFVDSDGLYHLYYQCMLEILSWEYNLLTLFRQPDCQCGWQSTLGTRNKR